MKLVHTSQPDMAQKEIIFALWNAEYPEKLIHQTIDDLDLYLNGLKNQQHTFLSDNHDITQGWSFSFDRDGETWFVIIINRSFKQQGLGSLLLGQLKEKYTRLSGWVIDHNSDHKKDGSHYISPLQFYLKQDFNIIPGVKLENENISAIKIEWIKNRR